MLLGNVAVDDVYWQPHISVFGKVNKTDFIWWDPLIFATQPQDWRSNILLLLVGIFKEQWSGSTVTLFSFFFF